jgi:hypothetical protein
MGSDDAKAWLRGSLAQDAWERRPENIDRPKRDLIAEYGAHRPEPEHVATPLLDASTIVPAPRTPAEVLRAMGVEPTGWRVEQRRNSDWLAVSSFATKVIHDAKRHAEEGARILTHGPYTARAVPYWTIVGGAE